MIFGSLFSGIEAASCAWLPLGWTCAWTAEIDPFACAVLRHHYPDTPNLGDVNRIDPDAVEPVDLVVFGSPCQSFSVAGKRLGLDDPRGNMALVGLRLIGKLRPRWVVWENVPGILSSDGGRDFGAFLGLLGQLGYGFAHTILDAQHAGVPQRRRRVFVVGYLGDWRPPAAVLFEQSCLQWNPPPRREAGERIAQPVASCAPGGSGYRCDADTADNLIAPALRGNPWSDHAGDENRLIARCVATGSNAQRYDYETETLIVPPLMARSSRGGSQPLSPGFQTDGHIVTHALRADGFDASEDGTGRGTPLVIQNATRGQDQNGLGVSTDGVAYTLDNASQHAVMTLAIRGRGDSHDLEWRDDGTANAVLTPNGGRAGIGVGAVAVIAENGSDIQIGNGANVGAISTGQRAGHADNITQGMSVRRLTPTECEKLQGLPPGYTEVPYRGKPAADGPRYRAIGNSMAVPVIRWIGQRIAMFEGAA